MKNKFKFDLDDYEEEYDDFFEKENTEVDSGEIIEDNTVDYDNFNEVSEFSNYDYNDNTDDNTNDEISSLDKRNLNIDLSLIYKCFSSIGVIIAIILISVFITKGEFNNLFTYILLLVGSFMFGYFFMFLFDKYKENN